MKIASWNVNSLKVRLPHVLDWLARVQPDALCLQELKLEDRNFPAEALSAAGYHSTFSGQKTYNGVAILSRTPVKVVRTAPDWCGRGDCRHLNVRIDAKGGPVELHDFYVPAGGDIPDREQNVKFGHKLDFVDEARAWFGKRKKLARTIVVGDLNIAPMENDVWSHRQLLNVVSHTPPETERLDAWLATGFVDAVRHFVPPSEKLFTWWSYRNQDWRKSDRGRRLDHIWVTPDLRGKLRSHAVLKDARDWQQGSDHVPVAVELAI